MHNTLFGCKPGYILVDSPDFVSKVYPYPGYCATDSLTQVKEVRRKGMGIINIFQQIPVLYGIVAEFPVARGLVAQAKKTHMSYVNYMPAPLVLVVLTYRNSRIPWYGYECRTELREVPGTGTNVLQTLQKYLIGANTPGMVRAYPT